MATIRARKRADGTVGYTVQIRITRGGIAHAETQTFDRQAAAKVWAGQREAELSKPGALERAATADTTLSQAIDRYILESLKEIGKTKAQVLRSIKDYPIAGMECERITSADIVAFATELSGARKPQTVGNYISHLAAIFAIAGPAWGIRLDQAAMSSAQKVMRRLGTTSKSANRDRRPTLDELERIMGHYAQRQAQRPAMASMTSIVAFAIFSTRRQAEITRIRWDDLEESEGRVLVRDMKNPGEKIGNHVWVDVRPEAMAIIKAQPRTAPEIFPYSADSISASFTRACQLLEIEDLDFHDLRHDGVSRLFEMGDSVARVASVSGHRSWSSLKRYTHIRQSGDKYDGWRWLKEISSGVQ
ncbi:site-specific integrase [Devosia sp.]|uniref:site-specific integrase n=1 Tax=Devosia sp. TaxID=1871048 RepID=UPI0037BEA6F4